MWDGTAFSGTKVALIHDGHILAYLRDDKPDIPFRGMWDLPGGGREGDEGPIACGLREVEEEFGLRLDPSDVILIEQHASSSGGLDTCFCAMSLGDDDVARIRFGNEGQCWELMPLLDFVRHEKAVPQLKDRLRAAMETGII